MQKIHPQGWSRRKFIAGVTGAGAFMLLNPLFSWAVPETDPKVARLVARTMGIDTHNHIDVPLEQSALPGPQADLAGEMKRSGLSAICMTFATDYQRTQNPEAHFDRFMNGMTAMDALLHDNHMQRALNRTDLQVAHKKQQPTVIQSVEGAHFLDGKIERLELAYERGLRHLTLLHDSDAAVPLGDVYTNQPQWNGLTAFGTEVMRACNRLGIVTDLAHAAQPTLEAALKIAKQPVIVSHTGLNTRKGTNERMAQMMAPRLISAEQAKMVADSGGVIGVWTHLADSPAAYAANIRALADIVGVDHVCIGTDTKLTPAYRAPDTGMRQGEQGPGPQGAPGQGPRQEQGAQQGQGPQAGNKQHQGRPGERTNEAWQDMKAGFYYAVVAALLDAGFNEAEIGKIGGGNFCRVFEAATAGH